MQVVPNRTNRKRGLGKRTRRALIRLRHALMREKFTRWAFQTNSLPPFELASRPWRTAAWHEWHRQTGGV
jgi:hypothetical protein